MSKLFKPKTPKREQKAMPEQDLQSADKAKRRRESKNRGQSTIMSETLG